MWAGFAICVTLTSAIFGLLVTKRLCSGAESSSLCFGSWLSFALVNAEFFCIPDGCADFWVYDN